MDLPNHMARTLAELDRDLTVQNFQLGRIVSDIESEKRTRAKVNETIIEKLENLDERQRKSEAWQNKMIGGLMVLQFLTMMFVALKK